MAQERSETQETERKGQQIKQYKCDLCGARFTSGDDLCKHQEYCELVSCLCHADRFNEFTARSVS